MFPLKLFILRIHISIICKEHELIGNQILPFLHSMGRSSSTFSNASVTLRAKSSVYVVLNPLQIDSRSTKIIRKEYCKISSACRIFLGYQSRVSVETIVFFSYCRRVHERYVYTKDLIIYYGLTLYYENYFTYHLKNQCYFLKHSNDRNFRTCH